MSDLHEFETFPKIARLNRPMVITEKIDGTNAQVVIETIGQDTEDYEFWNKIIGQDEPDIDLAHFIDNNLSAVVRNGHGINLIRVGSRNKWIRPGKQHDNQGFARWVADNAQHVVALGHGRHYGEWWGRGIQRGYGLDEKRFTLFNTARWNDENTPAGISVVPVLYEGPFSTAAVHDAVEALKDGGSVVAPGWDKPEGVVVFHTAANFPFKVTCEGDESPKGLA